MNTRESRYRRINMPATLAHRGQKTLQLPDSGVDAALGRADGNGQRVGRLAILQPLEIDKHDRTPKVFRKVANRPAKVVVPLGRLQQVGRIGGLAVQKVDQPPRVAVVLAEDLLVETYQAMTPLLPLKVDRLIRGNPVEPRPNPAARFDLIALRIDLLVRLLIHILGRFTASGLNAKITVEFAFIAMDQFLERPSLARVAVLQQKIFVRTGQPRGRIVRRRRGFQSDVHLSTYCCCFLDAA